MKKLFFVIVALTFLCSCAMQQKMIHPDSRRINCKVYYYGWIGVIMAAQMVNDCIVHHETLGFSEAEEDQYGHWIAKKK